MDGTFIHAKGKFATLEAFELRQALFDFVTKIDQALGVILQDYTRVRHAHRTGATDEEGLAQAFLELANGEADGGLRAVEALGGTRKAAFLGDG